MEKNFDAAAADWDNNEAHLQRVEKIAAAIEKVVPLHEGMQGIEVGSGTGLLGFKLLPRISHMTFADSSRQMLARVEEKGRAFPGKTAIYHTDIAQADLPGAYDLILALMTFHHMPDIEKNIRRMCSHLKAGGYFCMADLVEDGGHFHKHRGHAAAYEGFKPERIRELFAVNGLKDILASIPYTGRGEGEKQAHNIFLVTGHKV